MFAIAGLVQPGKPVDAAPLARTRAAGQAPVAPTSTASAPIRMTAADLWAAYSKDAVAADRLYRDKPLVVTGRLLMTPARDFRGNMVLRLGTGDALEMVHAALIGRDTLIDSLPSKGQTVTVACVGHGTVLGAPMLGACSLE